MQRFVQGLKKNKVGMPLGRSTDPVCNHVFKNHIMLRAGPRLQKHDGPTMHFKNIVFQQSVRDCSGNPVELLL